MNRRNFVALLLSAPLAFFAGFGRAFGAGKKINLASPDEAMPKALGYVTDASKAPAAQRTDAAAKCNNCMHYGTKDEVTEGGKKVAPCALFSGKYVTSDGWCRSWFKKA